MDLSTYNTISCNGVVFEGIKNIEIIESVDEEFDNKLLFDITNDISIRGTLKVRTKHNKKTFKKWLMSRGYSRDVAEEVCYLVKLFGGRVTYNSLYLYILLGGKTQ